MQLTEYQAQRLEEIARALESEGLPISARDLRMIASGDTDAPSLSPDPIIAKRFLTESAGYTCQCSLYLDDPLFGIQACPRKAIAVAFEPVDGRGPYLFCEYHINERFTASVRTIWKLLRLDSISIHEAPPIGSKFRLIDV